MEDKIYIKGFNAGYLLEKYLPSLSQLLVRNIQNSEGDFFEGFIAGSNEFLAEKSKRKSKLADKLKQASKSQPKQTKGKDKDKFDREK